MENIAKTSHPLILLAAASVSIASLAAAAHFTGLLPARSSEPPAVAEAAQPAAAPLAANALAAPPNPAAEPAAKPAPRRIAAPVTPRSPQGSHQPGASRRDGRESAGRDEAGSQRISSSDAGINTFPASHYPATATQAPPAARQECQDCGTVENIREVAAKGEGTGLGAIAGGVLGGVLGNQVGGGTGKDLATIAGAVGGAFAGHQVEKNVRGEKQYQVSVRFDDGTLRTYPLAAANWRTGDRVRLVNGRLVSLGDR